jgi:hypothetical protein
VNRHSLQSPVRGTGAVSRIVAGATAALVGMAAYSEGNAGGGEFTCRARQLMLRMSTAVAPLPGAVKPKLTKAEQVEAKLNKGWTPVKEAPSKVVVLDMLTNLLLRKGKRGVLEKPHDIAQVQLSALAMLLAFTPDIAALAAPPRDGLVDIGSANKTDPTGAAARAKAEFRRIELQHDDEKVEAEAAAAEAKGMTRAQVKAAAKEREKTKAKKKQMENRRRTQEAVNSVASGTANPVDRPLIPPVHPLLKNATGNDGRAFVRALVSAASRWALPAQPYIATALWQLCVADSSGKVRRWASAAGGARVLMRWVQSVVAYAEGADISQVKCAVQFRRMSAALDSHGQDMAEVTGKPKGKKHHRQGSLPPSRRQGSVDVDFGSEVRLLSLLLALALPFVACLFAIASPACSPHSFLNQRTRTTPTKTKMTEKHRQWRRYTLVCSTCLFRANCTVMHVCSQCPFSYSWPCPPIPYSRRLRSTGSGAQCRWSVVLGPLSWGPWWAQSGPCW